MNGALTMTADGLPPAASNAALLLLALVVLFGALALLGAFLIFSRRRHVREVRELLLSVEELRQNPGGTEVELGPGSSLGLIADAVNRLGQDLAARGSSEELTGQRMRSAVDALQSMAVITTDTDGDVRSFSRGASALYGWEEDELVGQPAAVLFRERSFKEFLPRLTRRALRDRGVTARVEHQRRDGTEFPADISVRTLTGSQGQSIGFMIMVTDVSERVELESRLRESETRYRTLVEGLGEGVAIVQLGRLVFVNPAFSALCGRSPEKLQGTPLRQLVATRDLLQLEELLSSVESGQDDHQELEVGLIDENGIVRAELKIQAGGVEYDGGSAALLLIRDETVRRRVEAELKRNEARLDAVIEATHDGLLVLDAGTDGGRVVMANRAFASLFDLPLSHLLGTTGQRLGRLMRAHEEGVAPLALILARSDRTVDEETILLGTGDSTAPREVLVRVTHLADRRGGRNGRVVTLRDVTQQRRSELQLQRFAEKLQVSKTELEQAYQRLEVMNDEISERAGQMDTLNTELRKLNDMKTKLLGNVSHELQTPLVSIRGYTEMMAKERLGPITDEQRRGLTLSLRNIDRLIGMIDNLVSFSRGATDGSPLELSRFPLTRVTSEAIELLREGLTDKALELADEIPSEIEVQADRDKVLQIFVNLLGNAVKFNRDGGQIRISARRRDDLIEVEVADTGVGIPRDRIDRIFERHYRAVDEASAPAGSGIGLAIVRDILRLHGCTIQVKSERGQGTTFSFTLPAPIREVSTSHEPRDAATPTLETVQPDEADQAEAPVEPPEAVDANEPRQANDPDDKDASPRFRVIRPQEPR